MTKRIIAISVLILLLAVFAWAQGAKNPNYWPGEGHGRPAPPKNQVSGIVTAVSPTSITIAGPKEALTFVVTPQTRVVVQGVIATIADVKVDDSVIIRGIVAKDGTKIAGGIAVQKPRVMGKITAVEDGKITLVGTGGTWTVLLTSTTKIVSHGYIGTVADLHIGYTAEVEGKIDGDKVLADVIRFQPDVIKGVVTGMSGNTITVTTIRQKVANVTVSDATVVVVMPRTAPNYKGTLADVKVNTPINVGGHVTGANAITGLWLELLVAGANN
jgi:hypothetical protein